MHAIPVVESSQVAEARRVASHQASILGFDSTDVGRVAIVASELATNLIKHGGGGELLIGVHEETRGSSVEMIALDRGRGIPDLQACLADGYSSAGTAGHGLGAIRRLSQLMEVVTWPDLGTAILARVGPGAGSGAGSSTETAAAGAQSDWSGAVAVPMPGEDVCGDSWSAVSDVNGCKLLVADGLGHGPDAAAASNEAVRVFQRHSSVQVPQLLELLHVGLRHTRGAALAVAHIDMCASKVTYGGIGNIAGAVINGIEMRRMVSLNGTAGLNARKFQAFEYPGHDLVILNSDGLVTNWSLNPYPGLQRAHPTLIAAVLYRDFARRRDDVTVLVARCRSTP